MISYAQNFEDVMIARLFPRDHKGFYIDVGAADPVHLSVTKHFYDAGWHGINVEPLPRFHQRLSEARPRDVNLPAVIGRKHSARMFFEIAELPENSTSDESVMAQLKEQGRTVHTHQVDVLSLEEVCDRHVGDRQIDFMKVDVEGGELDVLQSANWTRYRPVLLVIEAVVVNGREETWKGWEHVVVGQGYEKVWFDGLNNYYLRREDADLKAHFRLPPNVFDDFKLLRMEHVGSEWIDQAELLKRIDFDRHAKQAVIDRLLADASERAALFKDLDLDRRAKQEVIDRLIAEVASVAADRQAKQQIIDRLVAELNAAQSAQAARSD